MTSWFLIMYLCVFLVFRETASEDVLCIFNLLKFLLQDFESSIVLGQDQQVTTFTGKSGFWVNLQISGLSLIHLITFRCPSNRRRTDKRWWDLQVYSRGLRIAVELSCPRFGGGFRTLPATWGCLDLQSCEELNVSAQTKSVHVWSASKSCTPSSQC